ncbi:MAG: PAS domain S-box protein [Nitrospiraceae bacterium]|nr:MAG: PAS domain S-box protein [Nitrospiraceae bacterium]
MKCKFKTKEELLQELREMRLRVKEVDQCRMEYQKAQEKYERLLNSAPDAMVFVNEKSRITMINAQFESLFGYGNDEMIGRELDELVPERFREKHRKYVAEFFTNPRMRPMGSGFEVYARKKNGQEFPVDISLNLLQTDEELLVSAAIRDITARKQAEEQVEMNFIIQRMLNSMLKISLEPIPLEQQFEKILDLIISVPYLSLQSRGAIYLVGDRPDELVMKAQRGFSEQDLRPCRTIPFGRCLCGKAASVSELVYSNHVGNHHEIHHEGEFPHGHYCVPILSGKEVLGLINVFVLEGHQRRSTEEVFLTSVASTLAGIIIHTRTEQEKARLKDQLAQSEKLAALGRFTANVAHEIRNPLTAVGGFARRLDKSIGEGTKEKEYARFIISEVGRLEGILKNVLTFSRDAKPRLEACHIPAIVERVLKMREEICREKSISVRASLGDVPPVQGDENQFYEAIENLVINAIDAMPEGGTLAVGVERAVKSGAPCIRITITDSGVGIPEERLNMIFEPFFSSKVAEKGTGLGLSITKKVIEDHGGVIQVGSGTGKGTTFTISLPVKNEAHE